MTHNIPTREELGQIVDKAMCGPHCWAIKVCNAGEAVLEACGIIAKPFSENDMVINFNQEQTRKLELLTLWRGNAIDDKPAVATLLLQLVDVELGKARIATPPQPEKGVVA